MNVEEEVGKLKEEIQRLGQQQPDGSYKEEHWEGEILVHESNGMGYIIGRVQGKCLEMVKFGVLFNDDRCANIFEALVGTLRAAKKRKFVTYDGELLLQGVHDNVEITLLPPPAVAAA